MLIITPNVNGNQVFSARCVEVWASILCKVHKGRRKGKMLPIGINKEVEGVFEGLIFEFFRTSGALAKPGRMQYSNSTERSYFIDS